jgi:hypothetical protein
MPWHFLPNFTLSLTLCDFHFRYSNPQTQILPNPLFSIQPQAALDRNKPLKEVLTHLKELLLYTQKNSPFICAKECI